MENSTVNIKKEITEEVESYDKSIEDLINRFKESERKSFRILDELSKKIQKRQQLVQEHKNHSKEIDEVIQKLQELRG